MMCKQLSWLMTTALIIVCCTAQLTNSTELLEQNVTTNNVNRNTVLVNVKNRDYLNKNILPDWKMLMHHAEAENEDYRKFVKLMEKLKDEKHEIKKDIPFTIIIPKITVDISSFTRDQLKNFLLEHIIPGQLLDSLTTGESYGNINGEEIFVQYKNGWSLNDVRIMRIEKISEHLSVVFIDGFLGDRKNNYAKRNIQETNRYNEPQRLEMKNSTKAIDGSMKDNKGISHLMSFLASMKTGTKVFQHFLSKSNLSQLPDDSPYTILIPTDSAFQKWHPIDWGFYPFSVQEFTESILRNHFLQLKSPLKLADVKHMETEQKFKTLGDETVIFKGEPRPTVNNVTILSDHQLPNGNQVFLISEVLFVSEAIVSRLHQMNKDKETPPLLAFPWFGAQFLSHSFLALELDNRFKHATRFLAVADIAQFVGGSNYTFFVPTDEAFEKLGLDILPDAILGSEKGIKLLLNHFIKGRLYDRDLKDGEVFDTLGGDVVKIHRTSNDSLTVNSAHIIESEIFVYNLGTMFYIDDVLYAEILSDDYRQMTTSLPPPSDDNTMELLATDHQNDEQMKKTEKKRDREETTSTPFTTNNSEDVEVVPNEFIEQSGHDADFLLQDDDTMFDVTPRVLPVYGPK